MRRLFKAKLIIAQGFVLTLALLMAGCASAAAVEPTVAPAPLPTAVLAATPAPVSTAAPIPMPTPVVAAPPAGGKAGGSLTVAGSADVAHRDVHQEVQESLTALGPGLAYSRLLRLRTGEEFDQPSLLLECDLCSNWELTPEFDYEFQLRPEVHWQNLAPVNGRPLVAQDLEFSYRRLQTPGWPNAGLISSRGIKSVEALDSHTLRVNLSFLDSDALLALADGHAKIVAHEVVEQYGDLKDSPVVGSGPWIWERTEEGVGTTLRRNPDYFEEGLPFLDELVVKVIKQPDVAANVSGGRQRLAAFQAGLVDVLTLPPQQWRELQSSGAEYQSFLSRQAGAGVALALNTQSPPLDSRAVRQAIFKAMDPWEYVDLIWGGQGFVSAGVPVQSPAWLLDQREMRAKYFASPSEARRLLDQAGGPWKIELLVGEFDKSYLELGNRIAEDLRAIGLDIAVREVSPSTFQSIVTSAGKDYQVALGTVPPASTANGYLFTLLHSSGQWNLSGHEDGTLDALIERQSAELDPDLRIAQSKETQSYLLDQAYLFSPVTSASRWVFNPNVRGFYPNTALSEYIYWSRTWLEQ